MTLFQINYNGFIIAIFKMSIEDDTTTSIGIKSYEIIDDNDIR